LSVFVYLGVSLSCLHFIFETGSSCYWGWSSICGLVILLVLQMLSPCPVCLHFRTVVLQDRLLSTLWTCCPSTWPPLFLMWIQLLISLYCPCTWWIVFLLLVFKIFCLSLNTLTKMFLGVDFFGFIMLRVYWVSWECRWMFSSNLRSFQPLLFQVFVVLFLASSFFPFWDPSWLLIYMITLQVSEAWFIFLHSFFLFFRSFCLQV
jgi:hypothetical protein